MARPLSPSADAAETQRRRAPRLGAPLPPTKTGAALLSVVSNSVLILLKVAAGSITGSVAILTEAMHSAIDLIASIVALVSVRKADEPADEQHLYGHEKIENLAAAIEGVLILVGSGVIAFEAVRHLVRSTRVQSLGVGIGVIAFSALANVVVSGYISRRARATESPALEGDAAHLRTDALTSVGVLAGLGLVQLTGARWIDPVVALVVAAAIVFSGLRLLSRSSRALVDEALPGDELEAIRETVTGFAGRGVVGFHRLRTRRAGALRHVDLHLQFRVGTSLEQAHRTAHELQEAIEGRLGGADVLIHLEPGDRVRAGEKLPGA